LKFGIRGLFVITLLVAVILAIPSYKLQTTWLFSTVLLGAITGSTSRIIFRSDHRVAIAMTAITSILVSGTYLAGCSFYFTFVDPAFGFMTENGWQEVFFSFAFGSFLGTLPSLPAILLYSAVAGGYELA